MQKKAEKPAHAERDHYLNGGSAIARRKKCKGSLKMELPFWNVQDGNKDSEKGTAIHECGEILLPYAMAAWNQDDPFANMPDLESDELRKYEEDEIDAGKLYCLDILRILGNKVPGVSWLSEQKFDIDPGLELGGTADFACGYMQKLGDFVREHKEGFPEICEFLTGLYDNSLTELKIGHIWDYKNGTIPHDARTSYQIRQYIAGLQHKLGSAPKKPFDVIFGHIYGPNFRNKGLSITVTAFTSLEIAALLAEQKQIAEEALYIAGEPNLSEEQLKEALAPGDHCFWCKAKAVCHTYDRFTAKKISNVLTEFEPTKRDLAPKLVAPKPVDEVDFTKILDQKTDEQIRDFWFHYDYVKKAFDATRQYIIDRHKMGRPIQGVRCVESTTRRKYVSTLGDKEIGETLQKAGIQEPWVKKVRGITDMEKELKKIFKAQGMKAAEAAVAASKLLAEVTEQTTPGISIILDLETDPRKAIDLVSEEKARAVLTEV